MAVFARNDFLQQTNTRLLVPSLPTEPPEIIVPKKKESTENNTQESKDDPESGHQLTQNLPIPNEYKHLLTVNFPIDIDDRSREQRILDEAKYHIGRYMTFEENFYNIERRIFEIPVMEIFSYLYQQTEDLDEFRLVMRKHLYVINERDMLEVPEENSQSESSEQESIADDTNDNCRKLNDNAEEEEEEEEVW